MRKSVLLIMMTMLVSLTGCDFLRAVAGRPTGRDIEEKRMAIIRAEEEALQERLDSIRLAQEKVVSDSLAAMETLRESGIMMAGVERLGGVTGPELDFKYCFIVGVFRDGGNAGKLSGMASDKGYTAVLITCRSGMTAVGLCPSDRIAEIGEAYGKLSGEQFFPKEAWILVN